MHTTDYAIVRKAVIAVGNGVLGSKFLERLSANSIEHNNFRENFKNFLKSLPKSASSTIFWPLLIWTFIHQLIFHVFSPIKTSATTVANTNTGFEFGRHKVVTRFRDTNVVRPELPNRCPHDGWWRRKSLNSRRSKTPFFSVYFA